MGIDLPKNSITTWDEITEVFFIMFFPSSKIIPLRDNIKVFKCLEGYYGTWLRFPKLLLQCPTHGLPKNVMVQHLQKFGLGEQRLSDLLVQGEILQQSFKIASHLLDGMTKIKRAWYTQESLLNFRMKKDKTKKDQK